MDDKEARDGGLIARPFVSHVLGVLPTGSRVYGYPRDDSDLNMVLLVTKDTLLAICNLADAVETYDGAEASTRFGKLNLLLTTSQDSYDTWAGGTTVLFARRPVTRHEALRIMQKHRERRAREEAGDK